MPTLGEAAQALTANHVQACNKFENETHLGNTYDHANGLFAGFRIVVAGHLVVQFDVAARLLLTVDHYLARVGC